MLAIRLPESIENRLNALARIFHRKVGGTAGKAL